LANADKEDNCKKEKKHRDKKNTHSPTKINVWFMVQMRRFSYNIYKAKPLKVAVSVNWPPLVVV
jgi:hypothetical protein